MEPFIGEIRMFAGRKFAKQNWAYCDGSMLSVTENSALYYFLADTYGGDDRYFALPDLRGRAPMHQGQGPNLTTRMIGQKFGDEETTLYTFDLPQHNHEWMVSSETASRTNPTDRVLGYGTSRKSIYHAPSSKDKALAPSSVENVGGGEPHNNMQPFVVINFIIALYGAFPHFRP